MVVTLQCFVSMARRLLTKKKKVAHSPAAATDAMAARARAKTLNCILTVGGVFDGSSGERFGGWY